MTGDLLTQRHASRLIGRRPRGGTIWFTGLSGAGKTTLAVACQRLLIERGQSAYVLDGDMLRDGLNADLGFSPSDRKENVRRVGEVACLFAGARIVSLVPVISPYQAERQQVRNAHQCRAVPFLEVHVATPLEECEATDQKGLYARARRGELQQMTGIDAPYEFPKYAELRVHPRVNRVDEIATSVLNEFDRKVAEQQSIGG